MSRLIDRLAADAAAAGEALYGARAGGPVPERGLVPVELDGVS